jgi:hypothetical protein
LKVQARSGGHSYGNYCLGQSHLIDPWIPLLTLSNLQEANPAQS